MSKIEILKGRCVVEPENTDPFITENGIFTGKRQQSKIKRGTVVMVSLDEDILEVGNVVLYSGGGAPIDIDGKKCLNISVEDSIEGIIG